MIPRTHARSHNSNSAWNYWPEFVMVQMPQGRIDQTVSIDLLMEHMCVCDCRTLQDNMHVINIDNMWLIM
jgi:hypothetical protein